MKSRFFQPIFFLSFLIVGTQQVNAQSLKQEEVHVSRQCSLIRELVTAGKNEHFAPIQRQQIGSTQGYKVDGSWEFKTTRYDADLRWPGANRNYLENYVDNTDTSRSTTWQYIAEYTHLVNANSAKDIYIYLNRQIEGCRFPMDDGTIVDFKPLPDSMLPHDRPAILETASLYNLPVLALDKNSTIHVMVGMEKRLHDEYNVCLIVENVDKKSVAGQAKTKHSLRLQ